MSGYELEWESFLSRLVHFDNNALPERELLLREARHIYKNNPIAKRESDILLSSQSETIIAQPDDIPSYAELGKARQLHHAAKSESYLLHAELVGLLEEFVQDKDSGWYE